MINNDEALIFLEEIGRLINDYYRCEDHEIKNQIFKDIQLLASAISPETTD
ncbi:hypothetical protein [Peribacillus glennii]|uniref:hypothetical protein n=1 Tax=Peribacillus glennii TaxID=2303991 RepID=UPI0018F14EFE|nr:hypothetical protein [Peribacillus glennii]